MASMEVETSEPVQLSRDQILVATRVCLRENGYDATTIRRIAAQLGCAVGSIYRYFRDKRDLLYAATQQTIEDVAALAKEGVAIEQCEHLYRQHVESAPQIYRLMFWLACVANNGHSSADHGLPDVVHRIIDGWAQTVDDRDLAQQRWAALHADLMLATIRRQGIDRERPHDVLANLRPLPTPNPVYASQNHDEQSPIERNPDAIDGSEIEVDKEDVCLL